MNDELIETERDEKWFQVGKSRALDEVAKYLMEKALYAYQFGKDDEANLLRKISKHFKAKSEEEYSSTPK